MKLIASLKDMSHEEKNSRILSLNRLVGIKDLTINELRERLKLAEKALEPTKKSLDKMTAERSKWLRKLKRAGHKTK